MKNVFIKIYHHYFASLFLGRLEDSSHTFLTHNAFTISKLTIDSVLWILVSKRHSMGIDDNGNIIWNPRSVFNQKVSDVPFLQYMFEHAIPNTLRTIQIAGIAVVFAVALHYFARIAFVGKKAKTISRLIVSFVKWVIALCAVFFTMDAWGADTTTMLASAGVLTLIIGLGSQSLVADILAGIFIVFEGEFQVGDIVIIDSWRGEVKEIGIRTTKLVDVGGNLKIVNTTI